MNISDRMRDFVPKHVAILAGGTGGHIMPGLAVADELAARGHRVSWLGSSGGMEAQLVPQRGYWFHGLGIKSLRGKGLARWAAMPWVLTQSVLAARKLLKDLQPGSVLSMGGFAAGPGGLAARSLGLPLIVHEQNRHPGLTNRVLARVAQVVCQGFADSFPGKLKALTVGNPVRESCLQQPEPELRYGTRSGTPLNVLVLGGSQGARALNIYLPMLLSKLTGCELNIRHQCGARREAECRAAYQQAGLEPSIEKFIDDMAAAYAWADIVIARAGAMTVSELAAVGVASLLVPFPHAVDDHQTANARVLESAGGAVIMTDAQLQSPDSIELLNGLLSDRGRLLSMAQAAQQQHPQQSARQLADLCLQAGAA